VTTIISNSDDSIDSRDVIARIEELEAARLPFTAGWNMAGFMPDNTPEGFADFDDARQWIVDALKTFEDDESDEDRATNYCHAAEEVNLESSPFSITVNGYAFWVTAAERDGLDESDHEELTNLRALAAQAEGYASDWEHGAALIRDSAFEEHARQFAEDCGLVDSNAKWPRRCIDWEQAARELQQDYTSVEFDGVTYWIS
jgi:hypothetical protein